MAALLLGLAAVLLAAFGTLLHWIKTDPFVATGLFWTGITVFILWCVFVSSGPGGPVVWRRPRN